MLSPVETPGRIDEPQAAQQYADVLTRVAADRRPVIVRRGSEDLAAVVTPGDRVAAAGPLDVVAVTNRVPQPLPSDHVLLP